MLSSTGVCRVPKSCQTLGSGELLDTSAQSSTHGTSGKSSTVLGSSTATPERGTQAHTHLLGCPAMRTAPAAGLGGDPAGALLVCKRYHPLMSRARQAAEGRLCVQEAASVLQPKAGKTSPSHPTQTSREGFPHLGEWNIHWQMNLRHPGCRLGSYSQGKAFTVKVPSP